MSYIPRGRARVVPSADRFSWVRRRRAIKAAKRPTITEMDGRTDGRGTEAMGEKPETERGLLLDVADV